MSTNLQINRLISYYTTVFSKEKEKDISESEFIKLVRSNLLKSTIDLIRSTESKEEKDKLKLKLPAVTFSAIMRSGHKISEIIEHTGLIQMDFDEISDDEIEKFTIWLKEDKYTYILFKSPSGRPKVIVKIPPDLTKHKRYFEALFEYYKAKYRLIADKSCKDPSRLCFLSYDPDIYVNQDAPVFTSIIQKKKTKPENISEKIKRDAEKIIKGIEEYGIDITKEYKNWIDIIYALIEIFGDEANEYVHRVSRFYPSYIYKETQSQIDACRSSKGHGISKNSFFHIAKINGIELKRNQFRINSSKKNNLKDKFTLTEEYLNEHYDLRFNRLSTNMEMKKKTEKEYTVFNENKIYVELNKKGIKMGLNNLLALVKSGFVKEYDPIDEYFKNLPIWDGKDYIHELCTYIDAKDQYQFNYHLKKWLVRLVATALNPKYYNKQIFVFVSQKQNNGKSTLSRFFCPKELKDYMAENISLDRDSRIIMAKTFLINMDELSTFVKEEITAFKAFFSKDQINERLPYDRKNTILPRRCSFIGSTNQLEFLKDETGSSRWLCFEVNSIDWDYSKNIDIDKIYSQAYALYKSGSFKYDMTHEDVVLNEKRNRQFYVPTIEKELIERHFEATDDREPQNFYQATDVLTKLHDLEKRKFNLSNVRIGKALTHLGFERVKYKNLYGYFLKLKSY